MEYESGLKYFGDTELLIVYHMDEVTLEVLGEEAAAFDDNGGEPDGQGWYAPLDEFSQEVVDQIGIHQLGRQASGSVVLNYDGSNEQRAELDEFHQFSWCGYQAREVVYIVDRNL